MTDFDALGDVGKKYEMKPEANFGLPLKLTKKSHQQI